jgi:endonuclease YncB( thermonuclease family)
LRGIRIARAAALAFALTTPAIAYAETVTGSARVIDGDTIELSRERVRLFGIDAPETAQTCVDSRGRNWGCGAAAANRLRQLTSTGTVTCEGSARDAYGRLLGVCSVQSREINVALVREGLAWAFVKYANDYVTIEQEARRAKRGVFAGVNTPPWEFRAGKWGAGSETAEADKSRKCPIKGNVSGDGERIFHLPWQRDYDRVKVDEKEGERWFCTEDEAERTGWRRAAR